MFTAISISHLSITSVGRAASGTICKTSLSIDLRLTIAGLKQNSFFKTFQNDLF